MDQPVPRDTPHPGGLIDGVQDHTASRLESIGRFAGGIAHDFNNLLSVILTYGEFIRGEVPAGSTAHEDVLEILDATRRATALTRQLLAYSRGRAIEPRVLRLKPLIEDMHRLLQRIIGEDIELEMMIERGLWRVRMDASQFEQLVLNLAANARDAMPSGGKLRIEAANTMLTAQPGRARYGTSPGAYVQIRVEDTGIGMTDEVVRRIFEPFFTTKAADQGTGLGLATAFSVVKQAGGTIHVDSAPGCGTRFDILLPRCRRKRRASRVQTGEFDLGGHQRVLLVEDERPVRESIARLLGQSGYSVAQAENGVAALEALGRSTSEPFDLLVTDVVMPQMSGPELVRKVRKISPDLPVVFMTGYSTEALQRHGVHADEMVMHKPIAAKKLLKQVRSALLAA